MHPESPRVVPGAFRQGIQPPQRLIHLPNLSQNPAALTRRARLEQMGAVRLHGVQEEMSLFSSNPTSTPIDPSCSSGSPCSLGPQRDSGNGAVDAKNWYRICCLTRVMKSSEASSFHSLVRGGSVKAGLPFFPATQPPGKATVPHSFHVLHISLSLWSRFETGDFRRRRLVTKRIGQHLGFSPEDGAIPVFIAGHAQGQFSITTATELEKLADGDLLELDGRGHRALGSSG